MTTLTEVFTNLADAVRTKDGTTAKIPAAEIANRIKSITTLSEGSADATASAQYITEGKTAYINGQKVTGTYQHPTSFLINGITIPVVEVDSTGVAPELTATANDIRLDKTAVTNQGVTTGKKDIPLYRTISGCQIITANKEFEIPLSNYDMYNYTQLQAMIMPYNTSLSDSVAVDRVVIEDKVYKTGQTTAVSNITKDSTNKKVSLGITNGSTSYVIRYFVYKEEE